MIETGRVLRRLPRDQIEVQLLPEEGCGECHVCDALRGGRPNTIQLPDPLGVAPGDLVRVELEPRRLVAAGALLFILPILAFLAGYLGAYLILGRGELWREGVLIAVGCVTMALSFVPVIRYDRRRKQPLVHLRERLIPPPEA